MGSALCSYATSSIYPSCPGGGENLHFISGSKSAGSILVPEGERLTCMAERFRSGWRQLKEDQRAAGDVIGAVWKQQPIASLVPGSLQASGRNDGLLQQQQPDGPLLLLHQTAGQERERERGSTHTHAHARARTG